MAKTEELTQEERQARTRGRLLHLLADLETRDVEASFYKESGDTKTLEIKFRRGKRP